MKIGDFVRKQRREQKLTQQQLASMANVGLNFVYQLEKNKPSVQLDCVEQVLQALGYEFGVTKLGSQPVAATATVVDRPGASRHDLPW